jgi:hypothetical protein
MLNNHRGCAEIVGEVMTPWLFFSQQWPRTIRRIAVFVDQQLGDAIDMPSSVRSQWSCGNRRRLKCPCPYRSAFEQRGRVLRSFIPAFGFAACFLSLAGAFFERSAHLLCGAQQISGCKFSVRAPSARNRSSLV